MAGVINPIKKLLLLNNNLKNLEKPFLLKAFCCNIKFTVLSLEALVTVIIFHVFFSLAAKLQVTFPYQAFRYDFRIYYAMFTIAIIVKLFLRI